MSETTSPAAATDDAKAPVKRKGHPRKHEAPAAGQAAHRDKQKEKQAALLPSEQDWQMLRDELRARCEDLYELGPENDDRIAALVALFNRLAAFHKVEVTLDFPMLDATRSSREPAPHPAYAPTQPWYEPEPREDFRAIPGANY